MRVLRLRPADKLDLLDGLGCLYRCSFQACVNDKITASIDEKVTLADSGLIKVTLALPILKGDRFEWALEKMAEIGVAKILPIILERSVVKPTKSIYGEHLSVDSANSNSKNNRFVRWHSILKEAAEQCERATIPQLVTPISFQNMLDEASTEQYSLKIICAERSDSPHLSQLLSEHLQQYQQESDNKSLCIQPVLASKPKVIIAVGAEGGFADMEITNAIDSGFIPVSLGPLILRSETAAIYALAIATSCLVSSLGVQP
jgi:16S rRNA (uracil1498-N3)-methyltransferase